VLRQFPAPPKGSAASPRRMFTGLFGPIAHPLPDPCRPTDFQSAYRPRAVSTQCLKMPYARMRASLSKMIAPGTTVVDVHDRMCVAKSPSDSAGTIAGADVMPRGDLMRSSRILECGFRFARAKLLDLSADRCNRHRTSFHASSAQLRDPRLVLATLATP
jgi:hypothetical protein